MKKSITVFLIIVTALVLVLSFVGCNVKITTDEIWNLATFRTSSGEAGRDVYVKVSKDGVTFYEYKTENGVEKVNFKREGIDAPALDLSTDGATLNLSADYLANEQTSFEDNITTYKADIQNTKAVLDIENAKNAKITIKVDNEAKKLVSTEIEYVGTNGSSVIVTVTPYYN